ncbi:MAG: alanyl-tRNA editing protein [Myxococcales bacterium]|nr:alanyl-tRNA editing protein [Myxococcales bacterium]
MNPTERLYYDDPLRLAFDATVLDARGDTVVLDASAFYPESGGQLADRGTLAGRSVVDVQVDEGGVVRHTLAPLPAHDAPAPAPVLAPGARVHGEVERARRRLHMALHTGQHVLSAALLEVARADTTSSRLGESACTIDLGGLAPNEALVARAEELANAIVDDDLPVRAYFPGAAELAALSLRRKAKVERDVRVVAIGDFDLSPCGGTHCLRTAQVGLVAVTGIERYKGGTRVSFAAGARARRTLGSDSAALRALARELSCGTGDLREGLEKLRRELADVRAELGRARGDLAQELGDALVARAAPGSELVVGELADPALLRAVAARVTSVPGRVALLAAPVEGGLHVFAARAEGSRFDCGAFVKRAAAATGGRAGGRPEHAEGRLGSRPTWAALVAELGAAAAARS